MAQGRTIHPSPILTVEQALAVEKVIERREQRMRGEIKMLRDNLTQSKAAREAWQGKYYLATSENLLLKLELSKRTLRCRRRLIPLVKLLLKGN